MYGGHPSDAWSVHARFGALGMSFVVPSGSKGSVAVWSARGKCTVSKIDHNFRTETGHTHNNSHANHNVDKGDECDEALQMVHHLQRRTSLGCHLRLQQERSQARQIQQLPQLWIVKWLVWYPYCAVVPASQARRVA